MNRIAAMLQVLRGLGWGGLLNFALLAVFAAVVLVPNANWLLGGDWQTARARVVKIETIHSSGSWWSDRIHYRYWYAGQEHGDSYKRKNADVRVGDEITVIVNSRAPGESARRRFDSLYFRGEFQGVLSIIVYALILAFLLYTFVRMVLGTVSKVRLRERAYPFEAEEKAALIVYYSGRTQEAMRRLGKVIETCSAAIPSEKPGSEFHQQLSLVMFHAHARLAKMHRANGEWDLGEAHAYKAHALSEDAGLHVAVPEMVFEYIEGRDKAAWLHAKEVAARRQS